MGSGEGQRAEEGEKGGQESQRLVQQEAGQAGEHEAAQGGHQHQDDHDGRRCCRQCPPDP
eukprot:12089389-Alexandrium_andersonii.AAC.1